jgi:hypothetical protein
LRRRDLDAEKDHPLTTTFHSVGVARPWSCESAFVPGALPSVSKGVNAQCTEVASALQTLAALWAHTA